jgi:hypothetical protein
MNSYLANRIGRPDLIGVPVDLYGGTSGMLQVGSVGSPLGSGAVSAGLEGRVTAGVLIVALFIVAGFYVWTRGVQA